MVHIICYNERCNFNIKNECSKDEIILSMASRFSDEEDYDINFHDDELCCCDFESKI